ncbi:MAG: cupin domain-containing protein [Vulcanococcus sp.]
MGRSRRDGTGTGLAGILPVQNAHSRWLAWALNNLYEREMSLSHTHPIDETLYVVAGRLAFHVHGQQFNAGPGTTIRLPARTPHSSVAGPDGCTYLIARRV